MIMQNYCNNQNQDSNAQLIHWSKSLFRFLDWSFQGVNRLFALPFNANNNRIGHSRCYFPTAKIEDYNAMIDRKKRFSSAD